MVIINLFQYMTLNYSYTSELENLILHTLLPVYEKYEISRGSKNPLAGINDRLLQQIKAKRQIPALLKKKQS